MSLKVYYGKADRLYENKFFRPFASQVSVLFDKQNLEGILIGFSSTDLDSSFKPDAILFTPHAALIVDFKHYPDVRKVTLPSEGEFNKKPWATDIDGVIVKAGHKSVNPFVQLQKQSKKLSDLLMPAVNLSVLTCALFDSDLEVEGTIPGVYQKYFSVATKSDYLNVVHDSIHVSSPSVLHNVDRVLSLFEVQPYTDFEPIDAETIKQIEQQQWHLRVKQREVHTKEQDLSNWERRLHIAQNNLKAQSRTEAERKENERIYAEAQNAVESRRHDLALANLELQQLSEKRKTREIDLAIAQTQHRESPAKERSWKKPALIAGIAAAIVAAIVAITSQASAPQLDPRFSSCREANDNSYGDYEQGVDPEYDWYQDRDGDGFVCEQ